MPVLNVSAMNIDPEVKRLFVALSQQITAQNVKLVALATKLDADAGVTDTNYASTSAFGATPSNGIAP